MKMEQAIKDLVFKRTDEKTAGWSVQGSEEWIDNRLGKRIDDCEVGL